MIHRPKFDRRETLLSRFSVQSEETRFGSSPRKRVTACSDPDDNIFLECAWTARAQYVVTGNLKHFPVKWAETQIVTARQFVDAMAEIGENTR